MIEYIHRENVVIITNNILMLLSRPISPGVQLVMTGGRYQSGQTSLTGGMTTAQIHSIREAKCIMGVSGISAVGGITSPYMEEPYINTEMISQSEGKVIIVAEGWKVRRCNRFPVSDDGKATVLVTDSTAPKEQLHALEEHGITIDVFPL